MPLYYDGLLLVTVWDITLPCTGNNALLRPSAAAPLRAGSTLTEGGQEGREAGSSVKKDTSQTTRATIEEKDNTRQKGERERGQFAGNMKLAPPPPLLN